MLVKKQRTAAVSLHSSESGSDFDELEDDDQDGNNEPDLTFSTVASSKMDRSRARQSETEASDSEFENSASMSTSFSSSFTSSLGTSFPSISSAARSTASHNTLAPIRGLGASNKASKVYGGVRAASENQAPMARKAFGNENKDVVLGGSEEDEDMSREEVDCAAVLLGFGRV